jgi:hypothetical protein
MTTSIFYANHIPGSFFDRLSNCDLVSLLLNPILSEELNLVSTLVSMLRKRMKNLYLNSIHVF